MIAITGNRGDSVRSDCYVSVEVKDTGGLDLKLTSKVKVLYGKSIISLAEEIFRYFGIKHACIEIDDQGALPFTIAARIEAAVKLLIDSDKEFLLPFGEYPIIHTSAERLRRSRLYLPGNNPKLMINAGIYQADGIILDLEDSVAPERKHEARFLVRNALRSVNFYHAERMVRINQIPAGLEDLPYIVSQHVHLILIPKCESAEQVTAVDQKIASLLNNKEHGIFLMPIIESSLGVIHSYEIATASKFVVALAIGLEDYTADIGAQRTNEASESFYAQSAVINAARAAGIQPIDSVFSDIADTDALSETCKRSKALGFTGMGCIHPRQIPVIHKYYAPDEKEIEKAKQIVLAFEEAEKKGSGVVALGAKMIDPPVVKRALHTILQAEELRLIHKDWRASNEK